MQREQRESLAQLTVPENRSHSTHLLNQQPSSSQAKATTAKESVKKVQTQRLAAKNDVVGMSHQLVQHQEKQSNSFQALPVSNNLTDPDNIASLRDQRSIDEDALIQLAGDGSLKNNDNSGRFEPIFDHNTKEKRPNKLVDESLKESSRFDPHKTRPQPASKDQRSKHHSNRG